MISESRTSGCGRRPSVPSVIRLTIRPSRISSPTACSGSAAANSSGAETSAKPKPVADWSAAPASTATPAAISSASTHCCLSEGQGRVRRWWAREAWVKTAAIGFRLRQPRLGAELADDSCQPLAQTTARH
jgi:hypothetical protein